MEDAGFDWRLVADVHTSGVWCRQSSWLERPNARKRVDAGDWAAQYVAMHELRDPNAFLTSDTDVLLATAVKHGHRLTSCFFAHAERQRPWWAYAAVRLRAIDANRGKPIMGATSPTSSEYN